MTIKKTGHYGGNRAAFNTDLATRAGRIRHAGNSHSNSGFIRDRLPFPADYYREQGLVLTGCGPWQTALCPFHDDKWPSLRVNAMTGKFRCMACGVHGDIIDFHQRQYGLGFIEAVKALGAWEGA